MPHPYHLLLALPFAQSVAQAGPSRQLSSLEETRSCTEASATTFSLKGVFYVRVETSPYAITAFPNSTQLAFEVINNANGVSTGCSLQNVQHDNVWPDLSNYWFKCLDRSYEVDGSEYPINTSTNFLWDDSWKLRVNQTWNCDGQTIVKQVATATLKPTCKETSSPQQYIENCDISDAEVPATDQQ
ncbi:uncharacterized protein F4812DRAFT_455069 [Daldinia caldariorum]|uniref:uncharacterized protein n=1 Tax=Daldinia caldariorum TaxID=326644 RepID=UPI00200812F0|nr:uncharacterized protein F4812DRAFT_455069 [Daldinia caldariorum]KAI1473255.1 hypothetical protein F4812DRAFT_455069 [Daldinia caldariorum]